MTFDLWLRQIGFATFPLVALIPLGLGYLADATRPDEPITTQSIIRRFLLVWGAVSLPIMAAASLSHHYLFPSYVPLVLGAALLCADAEFWARARRHPLLPGVMGVVAISLIIMLGKDLERFPSRFFELFLGFQEKPKLPDDFSLGKALKALKYAWMLTLMVTFYGLISWAIVTLKTLPQLPQRLRAWRTWGDVPDPDAPSPMQTRARDKEALRQQTSLGARVARLVETPQGMGIILFGLAWLTAMVFIVRFVPSTSVHLSQRHIFQSYLDHADSGEPLLAYNTSPRSESFYLSGLTRITKRDDFMTRYKADARFFAIIPRERLAAVNRTVREQTKANVPVLNARSNRLVLISNKLEAGEADHNFLKSAFATPDEVQRPLAFKAPSGTTSPPRLDDNLELIGYRLNRPKDTTIPTYHWGDTMELTLYFKVLKRIPTKKKIFMHIDTRGNRLHGDHYPVRDEFPTNTWSVGDIIKDTHNVPIGSYTTTGTYMINLGLFQGSKRMKVTPRAAHDGGNRIRVGRIRVAR